MIKNTAMLLVILFTSMNIFAENIFNAALYGGVLNNETEQNGESNDDSNYMLGIYAQMINSDYFQFNDFVYGARDINDSDIIGNHFIFDFYILDLPFGKTVVGAGSDYIGVKTETDVIDLENNIWALYARGGQYFDFSPVDGLQLSFLPWLGYEYEKIKTEGTFHLVIPPFVDQDIDLDDEDTDYYFMTGLNFGIEYNHFLQIKLKYSRRYEVEEREYPDSYSAMVNMFFTRHAGISYRFKYMDISTGSNMYNMIGIMFSF